MDINKIYNALQSLPLSVDQKTLYIMLYLKEVMIILMNN